MLGQLLKAFTVVEYLGGIDAWFPIFQGPLSTFSKFRQVLYRIYVDAEALASQLGGSGCLSCHVAMFFFTDPRQPSHDFVVTNEHVADLAKLVRDALVLLSIKLAHTWYASPCIRTCMFTNSRASSSSSSSSPLSAETLPPPSSSTQSLSTTEGLQVFCSRNSSDATVNAAVQSCISSVYSGMQHRSVSFATPCHIALRRTPDRLSPYICYMLETAEDRQLMQQVVWKVETVPVRSSLFVSLACAGYMQAENELAGMLLKPINAAGMTAFTCTRSSDDWSPDCTFTIARQNGMGAIDCWLSFNHYV